MNCLRLFILSIAAILAGCATQSDKHAYQPRHAYTAAETSRTIDLTHPPRDMWDRIRRGFGVPNLQSDLVEHWTRYYAARPESVLIMSQRAGKYLYHIVDELDRRGLPTELALLPFVESAYNPTALSRSQASGLWQFIPSTGKHYNLEQDWWRDMRRDPVASTNAALDYLTYLYEFQGDWYLALASYNWGEGAVRRALERNAKQGLPMDYRVLPMPEETRNYVPKLQAIKNIIASPDKYGITLPPISNTPYFTTVKKKRDIDVAVAAQLAEMSVDEFRDLNPAHKRPVIKAESESEILLPADKADIFMANLQAYKGQLSSWTTYRSKKGESYTAIARKFDMPVEQLRSVNGIAKRQTTARSPTTLLVAATPSAKTGADSGQTAPRGGIQLASLDTGATPTRQPGKPSASNTGRKNTGDVQVLRRSTNDVTHTVKRGDTLFALARRYNTTVDALRKLNNLKGNKLAAGQRLRVPGSSIRG
ncbi:MAG TPA: transglycosylase SLT domain-containing protein [Burkholderiaceae bacterium]|nr:transglycosylase SLT domain-containing protein [Burkholderiaceae bacterium]